MRGVTLVTGLRSGISAGMGLNTRRRVCFLEFGSYSCGYFEHIFMQRAALSASMWGNRSPYLLRSYGGLSAWQRNSNCASSADRFPVLA